MTRFLHSSWINIVHKLIAIDNANELMEIILAPMMLSFGTIYFLGTSKLESF
jgi:hypothetical protein